MKKESHNVVNTLLALSYTNVNSLKWNGVCATFRAPWCRSSMYITHVHYVQMLRCKWAILLPAHDMATTDITLCVTYIVIKVVQADGKSYSGIGLWNFRTEQVTDHGPEVSWPMIGDLFGNSQSPMMPWQRLTSHCVLQMQCSRWFRQMGEKNLAHDRRPVQEFPEPDDVMATTDIILWITDVVMRVAQADGESYFRPMIGDLPGEYQTVMMSFVRLIQGCWAEDVSLRPTSRRLLRLMKRLNPFQSVSCLYKTIFVSLPLTSVSAK